MPTLKIQFIRETASNIVVSPAQDRERRKQVLVPKSYLTGWDKNSIQLRGVYEFKQVLKHF